MAFSGSFIIGFLLAAFTVDCLGLCHKEIEDVVNKWKEHWINIVNTKDVQALANTYADDAIYHEQGHPTADNRTAIYKEYKTWFDAMGDISIEMEILGFESVGDEVRCAEAFFVWGKYVIDNLNDQYHPKEKGDFLVLMKAVPSGVDDDVTYKVYRDFVFHCPLTTDDVVV